ncbi:class F sortase, partial [Pseudonocardia pini]|uniref:class F sortase n=1 Tax=Pseudonocardia pini TaxID=2758030 RepID=UPI0015F04EBF
RVDRGGETVLDAPVVPVGTDPAGRMAVPTDVRTVGWYRFGPAPGAAGSAVLAGHVDDRDQGRGAFHALDRLRPGDVVRLDTAAGGRTFTVSSVAETGKEALALEPLFRRDGPSVLHLVTCGGAFDRSVGAYTDNVVVTALSG